MLSPISHNSLDKAQNLLYTNMQRLSSGKAINSAADNPAGLAIANAFTSQLGGQQQAIGNIASGLSLTEIAGGGAGQITDNLQRIRELTVQAGSAALSATDRQSIQDEIDNLSQGIDSIANNTQFNGRQLLDGSFSGQVQIGPDSGDTLELNLGDLTGSGLGISGLDVSNAGSVGTALDSIDSAIGRVSDLQSTLAGTSAGLSSNLANLQSSYQSLAQARSRSQDTDYAQASSDLSKARVNNQLAVYAVKLYQDNQKAGALISQ
ncbi:MULTISPECIES: flagellin [Methylomonas]|uniref:flagellin n=1 Tax=Methylomonas TaxID=416 RepID=UPI0012329183|nr:flagellin [Methylomonas rhizoryzae]